jgi:hypothetical protein
LLAARVDPRHIQRVVLDFSRQRDGLDTGHEARLLTRRKIAKKESTLISDRGRIARHIIPLLGRMPVKTVRRDDVERFMHDVAAGKTAGRAKTKPRGLSIVRGGRGVAGRTNRAPRRDLRLALVFPSTQRNSTWLSAVGSGSGLSGRSAFTAVISRPTLSAPAAGAAAPVRPSPP